jgi:hypothetical protein
MGKVTWLIVQTRAKFKRKKRKNGLNCPINFGLEKSGICGWVFFYSNHQIFQVLKIIISDVAWYRNAISINNNLLL